MRSRKALDLIPPRFADGRHLAIKTGLQRHGCVVDHDPGRDCDVLLAWNLQTPRTRQIANRCRANGGRVIVAEEGYTRWNVKRPHFALALDGHNGSGRWHVGGVERWEELGLAIMPWRSGEELVVREQRGIGSPEMASPPDWHRETAKHLKHTQGRPIRIRQHPKNQSPPKSISAETDLSNAYALVTWASSDAVRALIMGVPVFYCAPHIVVSEACRRGLDQLDKPYLGDRLPALVRMAWAQWTMDEIRAGTPFEYLLNI